MGHSKKSNTSPILNCTSTYRLSISAPKRSQTCSDSSPGPYAILFSASTGRGEIRSNPRDQANKNPFLQIVTGETQIPIPVVKISGSVTQQARCIELGVDWNQIPTLSEGHLPGAEINEHKQRSGQPLHIFYRDNGEGN